MNEQQMRERYSALMGEVRSLLTKTDATEADKTALAGKNTELTELRSKIGQLTELAKHETEERARLEAEEKRKKEGRPALPQPAGNGSDPAEGREATKEEVEKRQREERTGFDTYLRTRDGAQLRAMNSTQGPNGGFTIPTTTQPILTQALLAFGGVIPYLDGMPTSTGEVINWPLNNDTANTGRELGENVAAQETDLGIGTVPLTTGLFSTDAVLVPRTLLRDSVVDLQSIIVTALATRRARLLAGKVINGSQSGSFASLLNGAVVGATTAAPGSITLIDIAGIYGAVDPGYANTGCFVMHRSVQIYLATLRNGLGAPIFTQDANGMLTQIFGRPVVVDQSMPALQGNVPQAGAKYVIFGDLKSYIFRTVGTMEVMQLGERYAEFNQVGFMGWYSAGGQLLDAGTHPLQSLVQHA